jgi:DNA-binding NtrC family response regulator
MGSSLEREIPGVGPDAMDILLNYSYPGNVRQLKNIVEHAVILCRQGEITKESLPKYVFMSGQRGVPASGPFHDGPCAPSELLLAKEKEAMLEILAAHEWNLQKTSESLHINRTTLWRKMKKHGLSQKQRTAMSVSP